MDQIPHSQDSLDERLRVAVTSQDCDHALVRQLVSEGANTSQQDSHGSCLLNTAIWDVMDTGDLSKVKLLLELGADVNNLFHDEERPLQESMYVANFELFMMLIDAGADVNFLLDEMESLLDWVQFDRNYHAYHSDDDERDREIVRFYDAAIPVLKSKGAKTTEEFVVDIPKKYVRVSSYGLWTASGNLRIECICPDPAVIRKFEDWKSRAADVWPDGPMPGDFDRHAYNMEGLALAVELRHMIEESIEVRFRCLDPIPCWWFQRNGEETIVPLESIVPLPLSYENAEDVSGMRGDVVSTAVFDVEGNRLQHQGRVLVQFRPLPFACHYTDLESAVRSSGTQIIEAWNPKDWEHHTFRVTVTNNGETVLFEGRHPGSEFSARVSRDSINRSVSLPDGRTRHMLKSHEYALWQARRLKGYHSETTFWWI